MDWTWNSSPVRIKYSQLEWKKKKPNTWGDWDAATWLTPTGFPTSVRRTINPPLERSVGFSFLIGQCHSCSSRLTYTHPPVCVKLLPAVWFWRLQSRRLPQTMRRSPDAFPELSRRARVYLTVLEAVSSQTSFSFGLNLAHKGNE